MAALASSVALLPDKLADALIKGVILLVVMIIVDVAWLFAGSMLARAMRNPTWSRAINIAFAVALLASVAAGFLQ